MLNSTEQLATAARRQLDAQLQLAASVAGSMIEGMEKFAGLNLQAARASVEASIGSAQNLLAAKDPQEFLNTACNHSQPQTDIALTYGRHLSSIASSTQQDLSRAAESRLAASSRQLVAFLDDLTRVAPAGSETALSMMKSVIDNASTSYAQLNKSARLAFDSIESNMQATRARIATTRR